MIEYIKRNALCCFGHMDSMESERLVNKVCRSGGRENSWKNENKMGESEGLYSGGRTTAKEGMEEKEHRTRWKSFCHSHLG